MSDDEDDEDDGEYESLVAESDLETTGIADDASGVIDDATEAPDEGADEGAEDDGAAAEESTDSEESGSEAETEAEAEAAAAKVAFARRVEPITTMSNTHRAIRLVPADARETDSRLHKSEAARVIATRAEQIARNGTAFVSTTGLVDPVAIAIRELYARRCPLRLRRIVRTTPKYIEVEEWNINDEMTLPPGIN